MLRHGGERSLKSTHLLGKKDGGRDSFPLKLIKAITMHHAEIELSHSGDGSFHGLNASGHRRSFDPRTPDRKVITAPEKVQGFASWKSIRNVREVTQFPADTSKITSPSCEPTDMDQGNVERVSNSAYSDHET